MTNITIKDGVKLKYITPKMLEIMYAISTVWKWDDKQPTITSAFDGTHMKGSLHFEGLALDLRSYFFKKSDKVDELKEFVKDLKKELGKDYDIVVEKDHIHVEFDV